MGLNWGPWRMGLRGALWAAQSLLWRVRSGERLGVCAVWVWPLNTSSVSRAGVARVRILNILIHSNSRPRCSARLPPPPSSLLPLYRQSLASRVIPSFLITPFSDMVFFWYFEKRSFPFTPRPAA